MFLTGFVPLVDINIVKSRFSINLFYFSLLRVTKSKEEGKLYTFIMFLAAVFYPTAIACYSNA